MAEKNFNELCYAEAERLAVLLEELGEAQQAIGKILRHGYASENPDSPFSGNNRDDLEKELGDVVCAIQMMSEAGDVSRGAIEARAVRKAEKIKRYLHHQIATTSQREGATQNDAV